MLKSLADQGVKSATETCQACSTTHPAWALYMKDQLVLCGTCLNLSLGVAVPKATIVQPWETEQGKYLKAQRNLALDGCLWTVVASPLSAACQKKWDDYRTALNRMTVDCADPAQWRWPERPALSYPVVDATVTSTATSVSLTATGQTSPLMLVTTSNSTAVKTGK